MALKAIVDSLESIPEALREHYAKNADGKYVLAAEGVEDVSGLRSALQKERENVKVAEKAAKEARDLAEKTASEFEGMDVSQIKMLLEKLGSDEEAKLIKEGKLDQVIERRTEKLRKNYDTQISKMKEEAEKALIEADATAERYAQRVLDNNIREAAGKAGLHPQAIDDALFRGRSMFSLDEEGNAVQVKDGDVVLGKDGRSAFSPQEWLESMKESAPHWFPTTASGAGARPSIPGGAAGKKTMTRESFDKLGPFERVATMKEGTTVVD